MSKMEVTMMDYDSSLEVEHFSKSVILKLFHQSLFHWTEQYLHTSVFHFCCTQCRQCNSMKNARSKICKNAPQRSNGKQCNAIFCRAGLAQASVVNATFAKLYVQFGGNIISIVQLF